MQILTTPHPFLKHKAKPLGAWDKKTAKEVAQMAEILKHTVNPKGVGLAATQVGLDKRLFILLDEEKQTTKVFVNPEVISTSQKMLSSVYKKKKDRWFEGCLSIPKIWGFVDRPYQITVVFDTLVPSTKIGEGGTATAGGEVLTTVTEEFSDVSSAYIQHEIDHLNGILFTDRIIEQKGQILCETENGLSPINL